MPESAESISLFSGSPEVRLLEAMQDCGSTFRFFEPGVKKWLVVSADPAIAEHVLSRNAKNYVKGLFVGMVELLVGRGIMVSEGDLWLTRRRWVQHAFQKAFVAAALPMIEQQNAFAAEAWLARACAGQPLNITQLTSDLALRITLAFLFGDDLVKQGGEVDLGPFGLLALSSGRDMGFRKAFQTLGPFLKAFVERRLDRGGDDGLSQIVKASLAQGFAPDVEPLVTEAKTLLVAGHETTASAMSWLWLLLARHPEVQEDVAAAASSPGIEGPVRWAVEETLRLYPPGWLLARRALSEDRLGTYELPANTDVLISPYLLGRNPALWEQSQSFVPQRFAVEPPRMAHIPFSAGPRTCVGDRLAMSELVLHAQAVSRVLRFRELDSARPVSVEARVNLRSREDCILWAEPR